MKKVILNYDQQSGNINTPDGMYIGCHLGLPVVDEKEKVINSKVSVSELKELKEAGYTAHEIAELRASGII